MTRAAKYLLGAQILLLALALCYPAAKILEYDFPAVPPKEYAFRVRPYDPYDHFRGRFLRFDVEIPRLKANEKNAPYGKYRYAVLGRVSEGFAVVTGLLEKPDPARDCVRIRYSGVRRNWKNGREEDERYHDFNFLFNRCYLNEKIAPAAERLLGRSKAKLLVAIYPNGNYAVRDLLIDGVPVSEAAGKEKK